MLSLCGGCVTSPETEEARAREQRAEIVLSDAEALPDSAPGKAALVADAKAAEREFERVRKAYEALDRESMIGSGLELASKGARGDYIGILEGLGGLLIAAGTYALARRKGASETERQLAELERRRDESRAQQGIAGASDRSAVQAQSLVAQAARNLQEQTTQRIVAEEMAKRRAEDRTGSLVPRFTAEELMAGLNSGVGVN